jgi:16S rRNA (uracil1498-N3)-methyltransferase
VGPEGGWTAGELDQFTGAGVSTVRLGRSILRTETAGPVAVAVARLALGDW